MKPADRLKQIENIHQTYPKSVVYESMAWLIARVKCLTEQIENLNCAYGGKSHPDCGKYAPPCQPCTARKVLEEENDA